MMNEHRAGDTVKITIYRGKKKIDVNVRWAKHGSRCRGFHHTQPEIGLLKGRGLWTRRKSVSIVGVNERYRDVSPTIANAWLKFRLLPGSG